jgi:SNF2 family DNA or RNA helicase
MGITDYHAKYFAYQLTKRCSSDSLEKLSSTLSNAQVDLNPHQIEAALFAFRSPLSKGAILADEVGLGKTIEAGLVISQKWAERKRKILLIVPSSLRKQWNTELQEKFFLPSNILEAKSFNQFVKDGNLNPFDQKDSIVICSYHFARSKSPYIKQTIFDLVVIDEAHRLRNVYKPGNKIAREIKDAIQEYPKLLLTATPLQNSLLELYGLTSIIDDHIFGDLKSFKVNYAKVPHEQDVCDGEFDFLKTYAKDKEILDFIEANIIFSKKINLGVYERALERKKSGLKWKDEVIASMGIDTRFLEILNLEKKYKTDEDRVNHFSQSRASYFRVKKEYQLKIKSHEQDVCDSEFGSTELREKMFADLRERLRPVCIRTLRRQVLEHISFRDRIATTENYIPTAQEIELYNGMSEYLQRPKLYALPSSQRQLITLILRKLLASSSFAIASTLDGLVEKLNNLEIEIEKEAVGNIDELLPGLEDNYESLADTTDEWVDDEETDKDELKEKKKYTVDDLPFIQAEKKDLEKFRVFARSIFKNSKGESLLIALEKGFKKQEELAKECNDQDIPRKAIIFTESRITQNYLWELLSKSGYKDKIVLFNGTNKDQKSREIYAAWLEKNKNSDKITGSKTADLRGALVDYFKTEAEIMVATEAAAEGINLQFCSLVINYDLPWNPQRIEQRIGRCHRYGQKHDVVVVNFLNRKNAADKRVYDLLDQKFKLFKGVFGASDEVLGSIESGVDFEKRIAKIYQSCRTDEEINTAFDALQQEMDSSIQEGIKTAKEKLLENFDADVCEKLNINERESKAYLGIYEKWLWDISRHFLGGKAVYSDAEYSFTLKQNPFPEEKIEKGPYKIGKNIEDAHIYRPAHPLAVRILQEVKTLDLPDAELVFDYSNYGQIISPIKELVGYSGFLEIAQLTVESFEIEDNLITAVKDDGEAIEEDVARKLFSLSAKVTNNEQKISSKLLNGLRNEKIAMITSNIVTRNSVFFEEEIDKLDNWSEDRRKSLKMELKEHDDNISALKKEARRSLNLPEKLAIQKKLREINAKRDIAWRQYDQAAKEIEIKKDSLLDMVERKLEQKTAIKSLFTIRWRII